MGLGRVVFFPSTGNGGFGCPAEIVIAAAAIAAGYVVGSAVVLCQRIGERFEKPKTPAPVPVTNQ